MELRIVDVIKKKNGMKVNILTENQFQFYKTRLYLVLIPDDWTQHKIILKNILQTCKTYEHSLLYKVQERNYTETRIQRLFSRT